MPQRSPTPRQALPHLSMRRQGITWARAGGLARGCVVTQDRMSLRETGSIRAPQPPPPTNTPCPST